MHLLTSVALGFLVSTSLASQGIWLELKIAAEKTVYTMDDSMVLEFEVRNRGDERVVFQDEFAFGLLGTMDIMIFDENGASLDTTKWIYDRDLGLMGPILVTLDPVEYRRTSRRFRIAALVFSPGKYLLKVRYWAQTELGFHDGLPVWNRNFGPLTGTFSFEVRARTKPEESERR